jgi:hypothetical protein
MLVLRRPLDGGEPVLRHELVSLLGQVDGGLARGGADLDLFAAVAALGDVGRGRRRRAGLGRQSPDGEGDQDDDDNAGGDVERGLGLSGHGCPLLLEGVLSFNAKLKTNHFSSGTSARIRFS